MPIFEFGKNWLAFLSSIDEERIKNAEESLVKKLGVCNLEGKRFLDIGCGSGLFSLAARRLNAEVYSFDADPQSVECARELKKRYFPNDQSWIIRQGSALDEAFLASLGEFDIVYSWGVLHHTGKLWKALDLSSGRVIKGGLLYIAIYNDQGRASGRWLKIKRFYNSLPTPLRPVLVLIIASYYETKYALVRLLRGRNPLPFEDWKKKKKDRGMSVWRDWVDWVGGLPFEVARPEDVLSSLQRKEFELEKVLTRGRGWGCNEYVCRKSP